jgi:hypothetical protein
MHGVKFLQKINLFIFCIFHNEQERINLCSYEIGGGGSLMDQQQGVELEIKFFGEVGIQFGTVRREATLLVLPC